MQRLRACGMRCKAAAPPAQNSDLGDNALDGELRASEIACAPTATVVAAPVWSLVNQQQIA